MARWPQRSSRATQSTSATSAVGSVRWTAPPAPNDGESMHAARTFPGRIRSTCSWRRRSWPTARSSRPAARSSSSSRPRRSIAAAAAAVSCSHSTPRPAASSGNMTWAKIPSPSIRRSRSRIAGVGTSSISGRAQARSGARPPSTRKPTRFSSAPTSTPRPSPDLRRSAALHRRLMCDRRPRRQGWQTAVGHPDQSRRCLVQLDALIRPQGGPVQGPVDR